MSAVARTYLGPTRGSGWLIPPSPAARREPVMDGIGPAAMRPISPSPRRDGPHQTGASTWTRTLGPHRRADAARKPFPVLVCLGSGPPAGRCRAAAGSRRRRLGSMPHEVVEPFGPVGRGTKRATRQPQRDRGAKPRRPAHGHRRPTSPTSPGGRSPAPRRSPGRRPRSQRCSAPAGRSSRYTGPVIADEPQARPAASATQGPYRCRESGVPKWTSTGRPAGSPVILNREGPAIRCVNGTLHTCPHDISAGP